MESVWKSTRAGALRKMSARSWGPLIWWCRGLLSLTAWPSSAGRGVFTDLSTHSFWIGSPGAGSNLFKLEFQDGGMGVWPPDQQVIEAAKQWMLHCHFGTVGGPERVAKMPCRASCFE
ncbi:unnamed protein product [Polarella glacialis]|uniref:Uncharacterized protein n=1 Tax=Polarella glacialis TaxID=89957 RepID=A0A813H8S8_POLGL|nr:unnamed protein product [Polarella glacialis]